MRQQGHLARMVPERASRRTLDRPARLVAFVTLWASLCGIAQADARALAAREPAEADARRERLTTFSDSELRTLQPLLDTGPVALVGFAQGERLPAITVATYVDAPAAEVAEVIATPEQYPRFMPMLDRVEVASRRDHEVAYSWRFRVGLFVLEGDNRMQVIPPPKGRAGAPYRVAVYSERGHMGAGRLLWKVHPRGKRSLLELSMRVDMRDANVIMQKLDAAARSINRSVNLALSYVMVLGTKREAEARAGRAVASVAASDPVRPPAVPPSQLAGLLTRGDLVWLSTAAHPRSSVWALGRTGVSTDPVRAVLLDPDSFGKGLVPGSETKVTSRSDAGDIVFNWSVGLPLVGAEGSMRMHETPNGTVEVRATEGSLKGGTWELTTPRVNDWEACLHAVAQFDIADAGFLVRKITEVDPVMGHGLAAATQVMMMRALRNRAWDEVRRRRAAERSGAAK